MRVIFLIMIGLSTLAFADFTKNGDIVTDNTSGLQWQDDTEVIIVTKSWEEALSYCDNLSLGGYSNWRLPNINELKSIVDKSKESPTIVNGFTNVNPYGYWSSSVGNEEGYAWRVLFYYGYVYSYDKNYNNYVRCVRFGE